MHKRIKSIYNQLIDKKYLDYSIIHQKTLIKNLRKIYSYLFLGMHKAS